MREITLTIESKDKKYGIFFIWLTSKVKTAIKAGKDFECFYTELQKSGLPAKFEKDYHFGRGGHHIWFTTRISTDRIAIIYE